MGRTSPLWHSAHYNALAKEIRELFPIYDPDSESDPSWSQDIKRGNIERRAILTTLALSLAHRFVEDNERFLPLKFLDACSPDVDRYPLSELWNV